MAPPASLDGATVAQSNGRYLSHLTQRWTLEKKEHWAALAALRGRDDGGEGARGGLLARKIQCSLASTKDLQAWPVEARRGDCDHRK